MSIQTSTIDQVIDDLSVGFADYINENLSNTVTDWVREMAYEYIREEVGDVNDIDSLSDSLASTLEVISSRQ